MSWIVIVGTGLAALGLAGIVASAASMLGARRSGLDDQAMRARMQRALALNMAAFGFSAFGLMLVVIGVLLG